MKYLTNTIKIINAKCLKLSRNHSSAVLSGGPVCHIVMTLSSYDPFATINQTHQLAQNTEKSSSHPRYSPTS